MRRKTFRFAPPSLAAVLAVASFALVPLDALASCHFFLYLGSGTGSEPTCEASYNEAFWNAVADAQDDAGPDCDMVSATVVPPVFQGWGSGTGPGYVPQCITSLTVRYRCERCLGP
jgi:hypothetical protein